MMRQRGQEQVAGLEAPRQEPKGSTHKWVVDHHRFVLSPSLANFGAAETDEHSCPADRELYVVATKLEHFAGSENLVESTKSEKRVAPKSPCDEEATYPMKDR